MGKLVFYDEDTKEWIGISEIVNASEEFERYMKENWHKILSYPKPREKFLEFEMRLLRELINNPKARVIFEGKDVTEKVKKYLMKRVLHEE